MFSTVQTFSRHLGQLLSFIKSHDCAGKLPFSVLQSHGGVGAPLFPVPSGLRIDSLIQALSKVCVPWLGNCPNPFN